MSSATLHGPGLRRLLSRAAAGLVLAWIIAVLATDSVLTGTFLVVLLGVAAVSGYVVLFRAAAPAPAQHPRTEYLPRQPQRNPAREFTVQMPKAADPGEAHTVVAAAGPSLRLDFGSKNVTVTPLPRPVVAGRSPRCDVPITHGPAADQVSRRHAEFAVSAAAWTVRDTSTNGLVRNGSRVSEAVLRDGDVLQFGIHPESPRCVVSLGDSVLGR